VALLICEVVLLNNKSPYLNAAPPCKGGSAEGFTFIIVDYLLLVIFI